MSDILPCPIFEIPKTLVIPGTKLIKKGVYLFQCPLCGKTFRHDDPYEPMCTGPSEMADDHAPEIMMLVSVTKPKVIV